jgi:hypothetical protein
MPELPNIHKIKVINEMPVCWIFFKAMAVSLFCTYICISIIFKLVMLTVLKSYYTRKEPGFESFSKYSTLILNAIFIKHLVALLVLQSKQFG